MHAVLRMPTADLGLPDAVHVVQACVARRPIKPQDVIVHDY